ncbi:hypothetical protein [Sphingobium sp. LB126]|uniref:hypothetical protein n=1 Tax=Sphingobium sp. LB126 TaxID=1983755 RepID=UPI0012FE4CE5|nr:hypothetical protein [Sphingobium sp. LB126]
MTFHKSSNSKEGCDRLIEELSSRANSLLRALQRAEENINSLKKQVNSRHHLLTRMSGIDDDHLRNIINTAARAARAAYLSQFENKQKKTLIRHLRSKFGRKKDLNKRDEKIILESGLFDELWYAQAHPDVAESNTSAISHYVKHGFAEGRWPNSLFDTQFYLTNNMDVLYSGTNPFVHYLSTGWKEGRNPNPFFDVEFYLSTNSDVAKAGVEPLSHYLKFGFAEGRETSPYLSVKEYMSSYKHLSSAGENALAHFLHT